MRRPFLGPAEPRITALYTSKPQSKENEQRIDLNFYKIIILSNHFIIEQKEQLEI